ncbi:tRNA (guanosine(37)-N1)-methyltransferase TrmD [bacterium]|nr:tRNA (guanosine(37)-N1)-methyltransferase TrmD [bacterium]
MKIDVLTLFPGSLDAYLKENIARRAIESGIMEVSLHDFREYTHDRHRTVDDSPYGGGPGMLIGPAPIFEAMDDLKLWDAHKIFLTPSGKPLSYGVALELAKREHIMILCGHYEGVDQRVRDVMDEEISIGDYVLSNGSVAAMVVIDAVTRLVPGTLGNEDSAENDSFCDGLLEYPQYTRPEEYRGARVPDVLLSGNHQEIAKWRRAMQLELTKQRRPDLLEKAQEKITKENQQK